MPRVSRSRVVSASPETVWELVVDPYHLPRWWPRCTRVEDVRAGGTSGRASWTTVLGTERGSVVRADYRRLSTAQPTSMVWEQEVEGTPFERILSESKLEFALAEADRGTKVTITARQRVRGLSRLGSPMVRQGTARMLDEALDGVERAVSEGTA